MAYKFGAHLSISGGYHKALERIKDIGGSCLQIFSGSPRGWSFPKINPKDCQLFIEKKNNFQINPVYFHASYLVNLVDNGRIGIMSKKSLINELEVASQLGIVGSIIHLGSFKDNRPTLWDVSKNKRYSILITNILEILTNTPKGVYFIIENAGNRKIGQTLEEISMIIKDINDERVRLCLDTCHLYSAGYSFRNNTELNLLLDKLEKLDLLDKLELWHVNDSRDHFNSGHDRHENIGEGTIGLAEFKTLLNHPKMKNYPFIIETPGFNNEGPDKKNLDILKTLING